MAKASGPESLTTAMPPMPWGVEMAAMVSIGVPKVKFNQSGKGVTASLLARAGRLRYRRTLHPLPTGRRPRAGREVVGCLCPCNVGVAEKAFHLVIVEAEVVFHLVHVGVGEEEKKHQQDGNHEQAGVGHEHDEHTLYDDDGEGATIEVRDVGGVAVEFVVEAVELAQARRGAADDHQVHGHSQDGQDDS